MGSAHVRRLAGLVGATAALSYAWTIEGYSYFSYEWITAKAILAGIDPHLPMRDLADAFGLINRLSHAHPRLPGALLLQTPIGLIPFDDAYIFGRVLTIAMGVWFVWLVCRWVSISPGWGLLVYPIALAFVPARAALDTGQYSASLVAGLIGITPLDDEDRVPVGIPLGVAITFKMWPWLVVPALWLAGRRNRLLAPSAPLVP